ncbi:MAG: hypothetical protein N3A57_03025 [Negativicutes bacterium]|nr:hypothetical protein [Negativicutes bacterium]
MKKVRMAAAVNKFTDRRRILAAVLAGLMLSAAGGAVWPSRLLAAESGEVPDFALVEAAGAMPEGGWPAAAANAAAAAGQSPGTTAAGTVIPAVAAVAEGSGGQGVPPGGGDQFVPEITGGVLVDGTQLQNSLDIISINGGKMLTMAIIKSKADAINASASLIQQVASGVRVYVVNKGTEYYLVISGNDPAVVEQARRDICFMFAIDENLPNMLLDIAATLKQFTESEAAQVGLPILPTTVTIGGQSGNIQFPATTWQWGPNATGSSTANNAQVTVSTLSLIHI